MEFTSKQINLLEQLKDMVKLNKLQAECEDFKEELEKLKTTRVECLSKRKLLTESLAALQEDIKTARNEELKWQEKLDTVNKYLVNKENDELQSICLILGFHISKYKVLENRGIQVTLLYRDTCHVTYSEIGQMFDLIEVYPEHCNFSSIKQFLQSSQDLRSVLARLRKFFDYVLEVKENQDQN